MLLALGAPPLGATGGALAAAQRLLRTGGGPEWLSVAAPATTSSSSSSSSSSSPPLLLAPSPPPAPPPALGSLFPRSLHQFVPPSPPAVVRAMGPSAVLVAALADGYGGSGSSSSSSSSSGCGAGEPLLPRRTFLAVTFAAALAAGSSVVSEAWREARILRPPRFRGPLEGASAVEQPPPPPPPPSPRAAAIARLEAARDHYAAEERALAARGCGGGVALCGEGDERERLQEARVVRAALERHIAEQRREERREERQRQRHGRGAA
jgi:hypothetical protein